MSIPGMIRVLDTMIHDNIPECAALNKQIREAYDAMDAFAVKYDVRNRQLPALLSRKYNALIARFDALVTERDAVVNSQRRLKSEALLAEYGVQEGMRVYDARWRCTGLITIDREGHIMFTSDIISIWPVTVTTQELKEYVRTEIPDDANVRTEKPSNIAASTDIPALERARKLATGR